jgi:hypothetical protein
MRFVYPGRAAFISVLVFVILWLALRALGAPLWAALLVGAVGFWRALKWCSW